jgi:hypothetical protein
LSKKLLQPFSAEDHPSLPEVLMAGAALAELGRSPASEVARDKLENLVGRA